MKAISGYEGLYSATSSGFIFSHRLNSVLCGTVNKDGYYVVSLHKNKVQSVRCVHRLIACSFLPKKKDALCVNHKNGIKTDNRPYNLEWVTPLQNSTHAAKIGLYKVLSRHGKSKLTADSADEMKFLKRKGASTKEIAECFNVSVGYTYVVLSGNSCWL